jgi:hypothetical protein
MTYVCVDAACEPLEELVVEVAAAAAVQVWVQEPPSLLHMHGKPQI